mgnify:CR=1 FL=1
MPPSSAPVVQGYLQVIKDTLTVPASGGVHYYCVSAMFSSAHPKNPGSESLCSAPVAIRFPENRGQYLSVQLRWTSIPNVDYYKYVLCTAWVNYFSKHFFSIYRTVNLNNDPSTMTLYDSTSNTNYFDDLSKPIFISNSVKINQD